MFITQTKSRLSSDPRIAHTKLRSTRPRQDSVPPKTELTKLDLAQLKANELEAKKVRVKVARESSFLKKTAAKQAHEAAVQTKVAAVKAMKIDKTMHSRKNCLSKNRVRPDGVCRQLYRHNAGMPSSTEMTFNGQTDVNEVVTVNTEVTECAEISESTGRVDIEVVDIMELHVEVNTIEPPTVNPVPITNSTESTEVDELAEELSSLTRAIKGMITPSDTHAVIFTLATRVKLIELDCDEAIPDPTPLDELIDALALVIVLLFRESGTPIEDIMGEVVTVLTISEVTVEVEVEVVSLYDNVEMQLEIVYPEVPSLPELATVITVELIPQSRVQITVQSTIQPTLGGTPELVAFTPVPQNRDVLCFHTELIMVSLVALRCMAVVRSVFVFYTPVLPRRFRPRVKLKLAN